MGKGPLSDIEKRHLVLAFLSLMSKAPDQAEELKSTLFSIAFKLGISSDDIQLVIDAIHKVFTEKIRDDLPPNHPDRDKKTF